MNDMSWVWDCEFDVPICYFFLGMFKYISIYQIPVCMTNKLNMKEGLWVFLPLAIDFGHKKLKIL